MTINDIIKTKEYDFLRTNPKLNNIILLGYGGSYAYGTNVETSDIDIRGIALNSKYDILTDNKFEQVCDSNTDTTIYSADKIFKLLSNCNPNVIEMLGLEEDQFISSLAMNLILKNKKLFLSKIAIHSFGGYAIAQLRRLENKSLREASISKKEKYMLDTIINSSYDFRRRYEEFTDGGYSIIY